MNDIFRIVYCSRNVVDLAAQSESLEQILATSRRNNARAGVTGALLYNDGVFVQTLEGPFDAVQSIFERIQSDDRHCDVVVLQAEMVAATLFGDWAMALAEPTDGATARSLVSRTIAVANERDCDEVLGLLEQIVRGEQELSELPA